MSELIPTRRTDRELVQEDHEVAAIRSLCFHADMLLGILGANRRDQTMSHGASRLSRYYDYTAYDSQGIVVVLYGFDYVQDGKKCHVSWTNMDSSVDHISGEVGHESVDDIYMRLNEAFELTNPQG